MEKELRILLAQIMSATSNILLRIDNKSAVHTEIGKIKHLASRLDDLINKDPGAPEKCRVKIVPNGEVIFKKECKISLNPYRNEEHFYLTGEHYVAKDCYGGCDGCSFIPGGVKCKNAPACSSSTRTDNREVIFTELID